MRTLANGSVEIIGDRNWTELWRVLEDVYTRFEGVIYAIWNGRNPPDNIDVTPNLDAAPFALAATSVYDSSQDGAPVAVQGGASLSGPWQA